jgi:protein-disulfide isomerase
MTLCEVVKKPAVRLFSPTDRLFGNTPKREDIAQSANPLRDFTFLFFKKQSSVQGSCLGYFSPFDTGYGTNWYSLENTMKSHVSKLNKSTLNTLPRKVMGSVWSNNLTRPILGTALLFTCGAYAQADIADAEFANAMKKYLATDAGTQAVGNTVEKYIKQQQEDQKKAEFEEMFKAENRVKLEVGTSPVKGPATAPITIIEFSDFQCPYCSRGRMVAEELYALEKFRGKIKIVFKNFPLEFHQQAMPAAIAALAANKQGKFWEFHDELFKNQGKLNGIKEGDTQASEAYMVEIAQKLGLNINKFKDDLKSPEIQTQIKADQADAGKAGVRGTPFFLVNGVAVKGALPIADFVPVIERLLQEK